MQSTATPWKVTFPAKAANGVGANSTTGPVLGTRDASGEAPPVPLELAEPPLVAPEAPLAMAVGWGVRLVEAPGVSPTEGVPFGVELGCGVAEVEGCELVEPLMVFVDWARAREASRSEPRTLNARADGRQRPQLLRRLTTRVSDGRTTA